MKKMVIVLLFGMLFINSGLVANLETSPPGQTEIDTQEKPDKPEEEVVDTVDTVDTSVASLYSDPWLYIKDELIEVPSYISTCLFPVKGLAMVAAFASIAKGNYVGRFITKGGNIVPGGTVSPSLLTLRHYPERFIKYVSSKFDFICGVGQGYLKLGGFLNKLFIAAVAFGGYKLTGYAIDTALYGFALSSFLYHYPNRNRKLTPPALREYFDDEYDKYIKGGFSYFLKRTKTVIGFVKKAIALHEANIKLEIIKPVDVENPGIEKIKTTK